MGCGLHCVIQKKVVDHRGNEEWVDLITGALDFPSSYARRFNDDTMGIRNTGVPADFKVDAQGEHNGYWMGEHSIGWFTGSDFVDLEVNIPDTRSLTQSVEDHQITIVFNLRPVDDEEDWAYEYETLLSSLQKSLRYLTGVDELKDLRFVVGYDS